MDIAKLEKKTLEELRKLSKELEVSGYRRMKKDDLV